jgi:dienelactone hydrolase
MAVKLLARFAAGLSAINRADLRTSSNNMALHHPMKRIAGLCLIALTSLTQQAAPAAGSAAADYQTVGVEKNLPVFRERLSERLTFPLSWNSGRFSDFSAWRREARTSYVQALLAPPPITDFGVQVLREEDRGTHLMREVVLNVTADSRVLAFMTVPKGTGPFPAVLLLHDHGGRFDIGKEKMIKPIAGSPREAAAVEWVAKGYGNRFVGDELARRGYVCFITDALNWSDRGGGGYEGQQAIASNLLNFGSSFAGLIAWEDIRAAEFLALQPEVDAKRIAALGWSMGGFRAWQVAALSDRISAALSICWMATLEGLLVPGGNLTRGASAYTMTHPGLGRYLDYADRAAIACPKPMLFFNGAKDGLFPLHSVKDAFAKLQAVWKSQGAEDKLVTKVWDVGHIFDAAMQDEAFAWLDRQFAGKAE